MWLWKDYRKLKCLKIERVPGKKTIIQCNVTWCWPLLLPVNHKKLLLVLSSTLNAQLLLNGKLNIKSAYLLFSYLLESRPGAFQPLPSCPKSCLEWKWTRVSLQASAALWEPPRWLAKAWRDVWPKAEPSIFGLSLQLFKKTSHSEFLANLYLSITSLCNKKKSGASACAGVHESPLWLDVHLLHGILELGVSWLDLAPLVQREAPCYQDPSMGCWGTLLGDKPAELQLRE